MKNIIEQLEQYRESLMKAMTVYDNTADCEICALCGINIRVLEKLLEQKEKEITEKFNEELKRVLHHDTIAKEESVLNAERNWVKKLDEKEKEVKEEIKKKINKIVFSKLEIGEKHQKDFKRHEKENDLIGAVEDNEKMGECMAVVKALEDIKTLIK